MEDFKRSIDPRPQPPLARTNTELRVLRPSPSVLEKPLVESPASPEGLAIRENGARFRPNDFTQLSAIRATTLYASQLAKSPILSRLIVNARPEKASRRQTVKPPYAFGAKLGLRPDIVIKKEKQVSAARQKADVPGGRSVWRIELEATQRETGGAQPSKLVVSILIDDENLEISFRLLV